MARHPIEQFSYDYEKSTARTAPCRDRVNAVPCMKTYDSVDHEWETVRQIRSRTVAVPPVPYRRRNHASWLDELLEDNRKPIQCYGMSYRVRSVSQYRVFPTHTKTALIIEQKEVCKGFW